MAADSSPIRIILIDGSGGSAGAAVTAAVDLMGPSSGVPLSVFSNYEEAIGLIRDNGADIVLVSLAPDASDTGAALSRIVELATFPVVALSGTESDEAIRSAFEAGATDWWGPAILGEPRVCAARIRTLCARGRLAEDRLVRSNESYRTLMQLIPDIVYIIDPDGRFTFVSDSIRSLGYEPSDLVGRHFGVIVHPGDLPNVSREYVLPRYQGMITGDIHSPKLFDERRSGKRMTTNLEVRLVPKEGSGETENHVGIISAVNASGQYSFSPHADAREREFLGTIGVIRDITERKRAEEEHRKLEEQLNQAHKMEAIGRLAGGVAHDFNNMLSGIMGYAEVIKRRNLGAGNAPLDAELARHIDVIIRATERAGDLTGKLLAFSRQGKYLMAPVNLHDTIREVRGLLAHTIDRRIEIHDQLYATQSVVLGDPSQLQNALLNLAMNARDAMPEGGILSFASRTVDVDADFADAMSFRMLPGKYVLLEVKDTGVGMDEQTQRRIFEPFFTTKGVGEGVGLGLSSVYGTVKSHGGAILVDSRVGEGTTFSVYLPAHEEGADADDTGMYAIPKGSGSVLVVDDEEMVRSILTKILRELGYAVATCGNGGEAITYYRKYGESIDLVILDMNMPVMSGAECLNRLREINPDVKVIIATGYSIQSKTQKILVSGVAGIVKKPFKLADLAEEIKRVLEE